MVEELMRQIEQRIIRESKEEGKKEGKKEGIKEGIKEGKKEGIKEIKTHVVIQMINNEIDEKTIMKIMTISKEELERIKNERKIKDSVN